MRFALRAMPAAVLVFTAITAAAQSAAPARAQTPVPLTGRLYVTSWFGGVISVVDLASGQLRQTIPAGVQNHNVYLAPDRKTAWVTNNNDGTVSVLDTASNAVLTTIPVGVGPRHTFSRTCRIPRWPAVVDHVCGRD